MLIISLLLAALVGFVIHRASLCTVRAIAEIISTRRAFLLSAFLKTVFWVSAVTMAFLLFAGREAAPAVRWPISLYPVVGGFVFGVGAAMNRGCAYSMLGRLADGDGRMVLALAAFCLGAVAGRQGIGYFGLTLPDPMMTIDRTATAWLPVALAGLGVWTAWELCRLWRTLPKAHSWKSLAVARTYRLSTAAALLGIANGLLYVVHGTWTYTSTLDGWAQSFVTEETSPDWTRWAFLGALVLGAMISAWQRGSRRVGSSMPLGVA